MKKRVRPHHPEGWRLFNLRTKRPLKASWAKFKDAEKARSLDEMVVTPREADILRRNPSWLAEMYPQFSAGASPAVRPVAPLRPHATVDRAEYLAWCTGVGVDFRTGNRIRVNGEEMRAAYSALKRGEPVVLRCGGRMLKRYIMLDDDMSSARGSVGFPPPIHELEHALA